MVCDRHINLNTAADAARYVHSQLVLSASNNSFGNMTLQTGDTSTCGSLKRTQLLLVCMQARFGPPHYYTGQSNGQSDTKMAADGAQEDSYGQGHNPFMVRQTQVWSRASTVQLVPGGSAATQCFNPKQ